MALVDPVLKMDGEQESGMNSRMEDSVMMAGGAATAGGGAPSVGECASMSCGLPENDRRRLVEARRGASPLLPASIDPRRTNEPRRGPAPLASACAAFAAHARCDEFGLLRCDVWLCRFARGVFEGCFRF